jgi:hypothetical protein
MHDFRAVRLIFGGVAQFPQEALWSKLDRLGGDAANDQVPLHIFAPFLAKHHRLALNPDKTALLHDRRDVGRAMAVAPMGMDHVRLSRSFRNTPRYRRSSPHRNWPAANA